MPGTEFIESVVLGVVQGIAEFLPISSSGHLVILQEPLSNWLGTQSGNAESLQLNVALHFGTLLSILVVYRADLRQLLHKPRMLLAMCVATIPVGIAGLALKDLVERLFETPLLAGCGLLVTAAVLILGQRADHGEAILDEIPLSTAFVIGLFQAVAIVPGISRSGSTIAGGLLLGLRREDAATFSFFIAIPAILGASAVTALKMFTKEQTGGYPVGAIVAGTAVSFGVGWIALRWLLRLVAQRKLHWFAVYCCCAAAVTIAWQLTK